ncbi:MAG TPA: hypothetical protein VMG55_09690 [Stellaceae bacterium]|nr:hypothetical protein [Stellaceae bacterium]
MRAIILAAVLLLVGVAGAEAQSADYCDPAPGLRLMYTDRAYLIEPRPANLGPMVYAYTLQGMQFDRHVDRYGQFLFDDGSDRWAFESNPDGLQKFWPLRRGNKLGIEKIDRNTRNHALVTLTVVGTEPVQVGARSYASWKVRRFDNLEQKGTFEQFLWYAPELCTLSAFTDSQQRTITLIRILKPSDKDYKRPVVRKQGKLYFSDTNKPVQ